MKRRFDRHLREPRADGFALAGFVVIALVTLGAFAFQGSLVAQKDASARAYTVTTDTVAGTEPTASVSEPAPMSPDPAAAPVQTEPAMACNRLACAAAYRSFDPTDCTFQPFDGPRRLCTRGG